MSKSCGGCQHFQKVRSKGDAFGICTLFDARCKSDSGSQCDQHKAIPYKRPKTEAKGVLSEQ